MIASRCNRPFSLIRPQRLQPFSRNNKRWYHFENEGSKEQRGPTIAEVGITAFLIMIGGNMFMSHYRSRCLAELNYVTSLEHRDTDELLQTMERTGLAGRMRQSVEEELNKLVHKWHADHKYKGKIVTRDVTKPLFQSNPGRNVMQDLEEFALDPGRLSRRELYYVYNEVTKAGETKQQIFCRGTTLAMDIVTCLSTWMAYDEELDCRVHMGIRDQAERILYDIQPLLAPPSDQKSTIEVSGHSLGGAVAYILAAKLRKRGYKVTRVTSIGAPRFCASREGAGNIEAELPDDTLSIENDVDLVPFMPFFGYHVGNKLYLLNGSGKAAYIPSGKNADIDPQSWTDSVIINFFGRIHEIILAFNRPHRMSPYIEHIKASFCDDNNIR
eukprot:scaffold7212_cov165-Cylindrotheca_fusiformis.AAC.7